MARRCRPSRSSNGVSRSIPCASARAAISRAKAGFSAKSGQTATAPPRRLLRPSGIEHRGVGAVLGAQPLADRAPAERAVEREVVRRQLLEAPAAAVATAVLAVAVDGPLRLVASSPTRATRTTPLPRSSADSTESASRDRVGAADDRAVDRRPRSGACGGGSASGGASRLTDRPSTRTRVNPEPRSSSQSASYASPSRRSTGAMT